MTFEEFKKAKHHLKLWVSDDCMMASSRIKAKSKYFPGEDLDIYNAPYEWFIDNWDEYIDIALSYYNSIKQHADLELI